MTLRRTSPLGMLLLALLLGAAPLASETWDTWDVDWYQNRNFATDERWNVVPLSRYNPTVPDDATAVIIEDEIGMRMLDALPDGLQHLSILPAVPPEHVKYIARYTRLVSLDIVASALSAESLYALAGDLRQLRSLRFLGTLSMGHARAIARWGAVENLDVLGDVDAASLRLIADAVPLRRISLGLRSWTPGLVDALGDLANAEFIKCSLVATSAKSHQVVTPDDTWQKAWLRMKSLDKLVGFHSHRAPGLDTETFTALVKGKPLRSVSSNLSFTDKQLATILASGKLEDIELIVDTESAWRGVDIGHLLGGAAALRRLSIAPVTIHWSGLQRLVQLKELTLRVATSSEGEFAELHKFLPPKLERVRLQNIPASNFARLAEWPGVRTCTHLSMTVVVSEDGDLERCLAILGNFPLLEHLEFRFHGQQNLSAAPGCWSGFAKMKHLRVLKLGEVLARSNPLESLNRISSDYRFTSSDIGAILSAPRLTSLDLRHQHFAAGALEPLRKAGLTAVSLDGTRGLSGSDVDALAASRIGSITLNGADVTLTTEQVATLVSMDTRQLLVLDGVKFVDANAALKVILARPTSVVVRL